MKRILKAQVIIAFLLVSITAAAQTSYEMFRASRPSTSTGIVYSTTPWLFENIPGGSYPNSVLLTVQGAYSNQQYTNVTGASDNGLMFGVSSTQTPKQPTEHAVYVGMNDVGAPLSSYYTAPPSPAGTGISAETPANTMNGALSMFTSAEGIYAANNNAATDPATSYYIGNVTFTFSRAVTNPVMHVTGLGGNVVTNVDVNTSTFLVFTTEYELVNTGYAMQKLSGTDPLSVTTAAVGSIPSGSWKIANTFDPGIRTDLDGANGNLAGSGSIRILGANITSLTFKVYLRGKTAGQRWSDNVQYVGDRHNIGWSMTTVADGPLPVHLTSFTGRAQSCEAVLNWKTALEDEVSHYEIERNTGNGYVSVGKVVAKGSNSTYSFTDAAATGANQYRLKMVDNNGAFEFSNVVVINIDCANTKIGLYPSITTGATKLTGLKGKETISVVSSFGQVVMLKRASNATEEIQLSKLPAGMYFVVAKDENNVQIFYGKVVKQ
ncbi:MAG: T9SS type A sorting domain-containing protein [Lacibacter sp.]